MTLLVVGLSACAGPRAPIPVESRVAVPATWRDSRPIEATPPNDRWWHEFGDDTLDSLVEGAILRNEEARIAIARVNEARAKARLARSAIWPHAGLEGTAVRETGISPFGLANQQTAERLDVSIAYDADLFGRSRNLATAASARLAEAEATRDAVRLAVASATAASYIDLRALDARLEVARSTLALRAESLDVARHRFSAGYAGALELRQAESEYLATQQLIPALRQAVATEENALSILLSQVPGPIPRGAALDALQLPLLPRTLPSALIRQRPDVYAAEQRLIAADRTLSAARAAFLPNITLEAGAGRAFSTLFPEPITVWSVGGSVLAPLFEGGALRAGQEAAAAQRDQAAFAYRATVLTAFREVEDQMTAIEDTHEQVRILTAQKEALAAAYALATRRYSTGYSSYLEQLDSQRGLLNAELTLVEMKSAYLLAVVNLNRAMGGGWHLAPSTDLQVATDSSK